MVKLLLVEDDKNLREIYGTRLGAEGYSIVSAGDGEEALALAIKERPDLIISDVMMPKISGFDMLDILRSTTETRDVKVIMMTALSSEDQRKRGEALGADRYLVKSQVGIEDVVSTVHEVLGDVAPAATQPQTAQPAPSIPTPTSWSAPQYPTPPAPQPTFVPPVARPVAPQVPEARPPMTPVDRPQSAPLQPAPAPVLPQAPAYQAPAAPSPAPFSPSVAPTPTPSLNTPAQPARPVSSFAPNPVQLPQPTAPFSTPRPRGLGDRIIQPINPAGNPDTSSLNDQMSAALNPQPAAIPASPSVLPPAEPVAPTPTVEPTPAPNTIPPEATAPQPEGLDFEETPRGDQQPPLPQ